MMSFYVTVYDGFNTQEYFTFAQNKRGAMIKGIETHRAVTGKKGQLKATARVAP